MRSAFPFFWIFQVCMLALHCWSNLFFPGSVQEFYRGERTPREVDQPTKALHEWVLGLEALPSPNRTVQGFFHNHDEVMHEIEDIWTPDDPSLPIKYFRKSAVPGLQPSETENPAWEEFETWILSGQPAPPQDDAKAITAWIHAIDKIPEPSRDLRDWVVSMEGPPPKELRLLILGAEQTLPISWRLAREQVQLAAPCIFATCLFTLLGIMTPSIRRPLARTFVLVSLFWMFARLKSSLGPTEWSPSNMVLHFGLFLGVAMVISAVRAVPRITAGWLLFLLISAWWISVVLVAARGEYASSNPILRANLTLASFMMALGGIMNSWYWLIGKSEDPPQDDAGIAQRRPPQLWTIWLVQFVILMANGLLALVFPDWTAELFMHQKYDYLTSDVVNDAVQMHGSWVVGMALFSYFALGVGSDWVWQGISLIFCLVFAVLAVSTVGAAASGEYSYWVYIYGFQGFVFIPITAVLLLRKDPWSTENVERVKAGDWNLTDLLVGPPLMWKPLFSRRRAFYRDGVGARGHLQLLHAVEERATCIGITQNELSAPGQRIPIQVRFSNRSQEDDASLDIRGCALQIMSGSVSRIDLLFATGKFAPFSSLFEFRKFAFRRNLSKVIRKNKIIREGLAAGMRRAPSSFADLSYYHQFVIEWLTPSAENRIIRFRIVPEPGNSQTPESLQQTSPGLPDEEDLQHLWLQNRRSIETRSHDYLRKELRDRLSSGQFVMFQLQVQEHCPDSGDSLQWYDASLEWDQERCPWVPLATIMLEELMSDAECDALIFDPGNLPQSLNVPQPENLTDVDDPRALAAARHRITGFLGRLRNRRRASKQRPPEPGKTIQLQSQNEIAELNQTNLSGRQK